MNVACIREQIWRSVSPVPVTGCWLWIRQIGANGYPRITAESVAYRPAHRISYSAFRLDGADIPRGLCVCHKCDTPACVNPDHLFLGTHRDNLIDSLRKGRRSASALATDTHCAQGHPWTPDTTYMYHGRRSCKACNKLAVERYQAKRPPRRVAKQAAA